jgi:hypothetical protein
MSSEINKVNYDVLITADRCVNVFIGFSYRYILVIATFCLCHRLC